MKMAPRGGRRRTSKASKNKSFTVAAIPRASRLAGGFPELIRTQLRYTDVFQLVATSTAVARVYGGNCLWDPYLAVGGHQPSNFDNWTRLYGFYTVLGVRATLSYFNDTTSSAQPAAWGVSLSYDGSLVSTYPNVPSLIEQPQTRVARVPAGIVNGPLAPPVKIAQTVGPWFGASPEEVLSQATYRGTSSTNPPSIGPYIEVWQGSNLGTTTGANTYRIDLHFDVVWSNPLPSLPS
jgi:hypothetical protein